MECLICGGHNFKPYYYPPTIFNSKTFTYHECSDCHSAQIYPLPDEDDMKLMYGSKDHAYLLTLKEGEKLYFPDTYPRHNYQGLQLAFFTKYNYKQRGTTLLDIGCGNGFYMNHAMKYGFSCYGIEFSEEFAQLLRTKTDLDIYSFREFTDLFPQGKQFDIIHLGHVLEHSIDPKAFLENIKQYAHPDTLFIIDGPLEKNKCLSRFFIKWGSVLKNKKSNTYDPQHITFTDRLSQLLFFERAGFTMVNYEIREQMFPFPGVFKGESLKGKLLFCIGKISANLSKLIPGTGNIFHYAGKLRFKS